MTQVAPAPEEEGGPPFSTSTTTTSGLIQSIVVAQQEIDTSTTNVEARLKLSGAAKQTLSALRDQSGPQARAQRAKVIGHADRTMDVVARTSHL